MKRHLLFKSLLLLCALVVGSTSVWADTVTFDATKDVDADAQSYQTTEKTYTATDGSTWKANGYGATKNTNLVIGKGGANYLLLPNVSGTISSVAVTWSGNASYYLALQTTSGTELEAKSNSATSTTKTFSVTGSYSQLKLVGRRASGTGNAAATITKVVVTYTASGGPTTYSVLYDGNGATSGTAPTDANAYSSGDEVTVLGNTGGLAKTSFTFVGWNTKDDGTGSDYSAGDKFNITANTTLYAKWNFVVTDGIFDFVNAAKQSPLVDYGSGVTLSSGDFTKGSKTWTAGKVTMVTNDGGGSGIRWWSADGTLRFYNKATATFSVPSGYVITKIVTTGANFNSSTPTGLSGATWTGASNEVVLSVNDTRNIRTIAVTYTTPKQTITPSYDKITYVTPYMMNFNNIEGLKAYVATSANASGVTMTRVEAAVPENTPLLLIGTANDSYEVPVAASATAPATNLLKKGDGTTVFDGSTYDYILYSDGLFHQIGSGTVATNKAYLHLDAAPSGARSLDIVFDDNETTGVNEVKTQKATGEYFNLAGQRVAQPTKGLYIVNGRKVIIK
jgi:uncharacterized repeat protein (TIGR02543 family)